MPSKQTKTSIETYHIQTSEDKARENLEGSQTKKTKTDQKKKKTLQNIRIPAEFSSEILQTRRKWSDIFKLLKETVNAEFYIKF